MVYKEVSTTLTIIELTDYLNNQLNVFFPDKKTLRNDLFKVVSKSFPKAINCFRHIKGKHFNDEKNVFFNHLHGDQYCMFIYFSSRVAFLEGYEDLYLKLSLLNKHLFSIDLFGHVEMPDIFLLVHPIGSIFGRAKYGNYFVAYQGVTIGGVHTSSSINYPRFGDKVVCFANATVIGNAELGGNIVVGANTTIINGVFNSDITILGSHPQVVIKPTKTDVKELFFLN